MCECKLGSLGRVEAASRNQKNKTGDAAVDLDTAKKTQSEKPHRGRPINASKTTQKGGRIWGVLGGERPNRVRRIGSQGGAHPPVSLLPPYLLYCTVLYLCAQRVQGTVYSNPDGLAAHAARPASAQGFQKLGVLGWAGLGCHATDPSTSARLQLIPSPPGRKVAQALSSWVRDLRLCDFAAALLIPPARVNSARSFIQ